MGSFSSMAINRIPKNEDLIFKRSKCVSCKNNLSILDLIPIASYILLKGRCRQCYSRIGLKYPLLELLMCSTSIILYNRYGIEFKYFILLSVMTMLFIASFIDLDYLIIPDGVVISIVILAIFNIVINKFYLGIHTFTNSVVSAIFASAIYIFLYLISRKSIGHGDIKLFVALSLLLKLEGVINTFFLSYIIGAAYSIPLLIMRRKTLRSKIAFGPFISIAFFINAINNKLL